MIQKTQDRLFDKVDKVKDELKLELATQIATLNTLELEKRNEAIEKVKKDLEGKGNDSLDKKLLDTKNDVGRQMHEICSMVEEIANMSKGVETQFNMRLPELE